MCTVLRYGNKLLSKCKSELLLLNYCKSIDRLKFLNSELKIS